MPQKTNYINEIAIDYAGRNVLVTGGSRGIGFGIAEAFALANANLHIIAQGEGLDTAVKNLKSLGKGQVSGHVCDVTDSRKVRDSLENIGPLDVFIGNAGLEKMTPIDDLTDDGEACFRRIIEVNVIGTYLTARAALSKMRPGGSIILTSSVWGKSAVGGYSAYIASKHANIGFMRSLARELGPRNIRVNCICPGWVKTDAALQSLSRMSALQNRSEEDILDEVIATQCLPGLQEPGDISSLYIFLASSMAKNITGQAFNVDRGEFLG